MIKSNDIATLRETTGMGILECNKALKEANGNTADAIVILRKKMGITNVNRLARSTGEGRIDSYIHVGAKVGVMLEINCESDFVANTEVFKTLSKNLCLQIAAANPIYITHTEIPTALIDSEKEILTAQLVGKAPMAIESIIKGRLNKYYASVCLLQQPFIKDSTKTVLEVITETSAILGENIAIKRFVRYQVGV